MSAIQKIKGNMGEAAALFEFTKYGIPVAIPYGDNERYDLIAEFGGKLNKIQIKTCAYETGDGAIECSTSSAVCHTSIRTEKETYVGDVDYFCLYFPTKGDVVCLVPIDVVGDRKTVTIRFSETTIKNQYNVTYASDYTFDKYFTKVFET